MDVAVDINDVARAGFPMEAVDVLRQDPSAFVAMLCLGEHLVGSIEAGAATRGFDLMDVLPRERGLRLHHRARERFFDGDAFGRIDVFVETANAAISRETGIGRDPGPGDEENALSVSQIRNDSIELVFEARRHTRDYPTIRSVGVLLLEEVDEAKLGKLLLRYGLSLNHVPAGRAIPGSYWGDSEAGLVEDQLYARPDTPIHSVLHEASHFVCMNPSRRACLERDAGGDDVEESAVCYLQVLLSDHVSQMGRDRMFRDMDSWGYSFRLGSTKSWFDEDAEDALSWLRAEGLVDEKEAALWTRRGEK